MDKGKSRVVTQRYRGSIDATESQVNLIKDLFKKLGQDGKASLSYNQLSMADADGLIKALNKKISKKKSSKKKAPIK